MAEISLLLFFLFLLKKNTTFCRPPIYFRPFSKIKIKISVRHPGPISLVFLSVVCTDFSLAKNLSLPHTSRIPRSPTPTLPSLRIFLRCSRHRLASRDLSLSTLHTPPWCRHPAIPTDARGEGKEFFMRSDCRTTSSSIPHLPKRLVAPRSHRSSLVTRPSVLPRCQLAVLCK